MRGYPRFATIVAPVVLALVTHGVAFAQAPAVPWANKLFLPDVGTNPDQDPPPVIVHDFGTVPHGTLCVHKFTLTNVYNVPMQVMDVRKSCGCLDVYPPQKVLQPNESDVFVVTMNTAKFNGPNAQTLRIKIGPTYQSTAVIRMVANSLTDVSLSPGAVDFGTVAQGSRPTQSATLEYNGRQRDWKVTGVVPNSGPLTVDVKDVSGRAWFSPTKYEITVGLKADAPAGKLSEVVNLRTNDSSAPVVQVNVTGVIEAPLALSTNRVQFNRVTVGEVAAQKVVVRAAAGPFRIQPVADAGDGITVETFPAAAPVQIVTVRFAPTRAGLIRRVVHLYTDLDGGASTMITIEGEGVSE